MIDFLEFMKNNEFLDVGAYQTMITNIEKFQKQERNAQENNNVNKSFLVERSHRSTPLHNIRNPVEHILIVPH